MGGGGVGGGTPVVGACDVSALEANITLPSLPFTSCPCTFSTLPGLGSAENQALAQTVQQSSVL
jgi:hypothetical protein